MRFKLFWSILKFQLIWQRDRTKLWIIALMKICMVQIIIVVIVNQRWLLIKLIGSVNSVNTSPYSHNNLNNPMINCLAVVNILLKNSTKMVDIHYNFASYIHFLLYWNNLIILKDLSWYMTPVFDYNINFWVCG